MDASYGRIPLHFEPNQGQAPEGVRFVGRAAGVTLLLTDTAPALLLTGGGKRAAVKLRLEGANAPSTVTGLEKLPGVSNYYLGNDPKKWRAGVPHYARVKAEGIYDGIDMVFYGQGRSLEYDFVVAAGADPDAIRVTFDGASKVRIDGQGDLVLTTAVGDLRQKRPRVFQRIGGREVEVAASYRIEAERQVAFDVGSYDREAPLTIDPVLVYSTYLGGNSLDSGDAIAVDQAGAAYVTGVTYSRDFPTLNAQYPFLNSGFWNDAFVAKLRPGGDTIVYSTYLGGTSWEREPKIAVDSTGAAYVAGQTQSGDFPTLSGFQMASRGGPEGFVAKLGPAGVLVYSTFLGGTHDDLVNGIAVDASSNVVVAGTTGSPGFPTSSAFQSALGGLRDAFVTKLDSSGRALVFSRFLGGANRETGTSVAIDGSGSVIVAGTTDSRDFPLVSPARASLGYRDAFVSKLTSSGLLQFSTYWGGAETDEAIGVTVDASSNFYLMGRTFSRDFPVLPASLGDAGRGEWDVFLTKFSVQGSPVYSRIFGGVESDSPAAVAVDPAGRAVVVGGTGSGDFPTAGALKSKMEGGDAFVTKFTADGTEFVYSTLLGGRSGDSADGVAVDLSGNVYVTGGTISQDFPILSAYDSTHSVQEAFITKMGDGPPSIPVAIDTVAAGRKVVVDGFEYTMPKVFRWLPGTTHTLDVVTPQASDLGREARFTGWAHGGDKAQIVQAPSAPATFTAHFASDPCSYQVTPREPKFSLVSNQLNVTVTALLSCPWSPTIGVPWITFRGATASLGSGMAYFGIQAAAAPREGTISIAGQTIVVRQVVAPVVTAPVHFQAFYSPGISFAWTEVPDATGYDLVLIKGSQTAFTGRLAGRSSTSIFMNLLDGTYTFRVRSCSGGFTGELCGPWVDTYFTIVPVPQPAPPSPPMITSPRPAETLRSSTHIFRWDAVLGATRYEVEVLNGSTRELQIATPGTETVFTLRSSMQYSVRVRACSEGCSNWSGTHFTVSLPPVPTLPPAISSATLNGNQLSVAWSPIANADLYIVQVVQPNTGPGGGALTVASVRTAATGYTFAVPPGPAFVIVAACNGDGCGPYSPKVNISPSAPAPTAPIVGTPIAGTIVSGPNVILTWSRVPGDNGSNTPYRLYVGDLSRNAPALDVLTTQNFYGAYLRSEGSRYDAIVFANPDTPQQTQGPPTGFNVSGVSAPSPTMVAPRHNSRIRQGNVTLSWTPQDRSVLYQYYVGTPGSTAATATGVTSGVFVQVPLQAQNNQPTLYNGVVRACNPDSFCRAESDAGWGPWSNIAGPGVTSFTVLP